MLWTLALLAIVAASFLDDARTGTQLARNLVENAKAEALADAGVERAIVGLADSDETRAWRADGTVYPLVLGEGSVRIRLADEAGRIDLNNAPDELLLGLLEAAGLDAGAAGALLDGILAFRGADGERRGAGAEDVGAEDTGPAAAGPARGARPAPFQTEEELLQVPGMTRELYERLAPAITVYSRREVDPQAAPPLVVAALRRAMPDALDRPAPARGGLAPQGQSPPQTVRVIAEATTAGGGRFVREVVLRGTGNGAQPYRILAWRRRWSGSP